MLWNYIYVILSTPLFAGYEVKYMISFSGGRMFKVRGWNTHTSSKKPYELKAWKHSSTGSVWLQ